MDPSSNNIWAKLVALRPENQNLNFLTKPDEPNQHQVDGEWKIYQDTSGDTKIVCLSASCIKVDDIWLGMNQEKKLIGGEMIAFSEEKNLAENDFDYVFCLINRTPAEGLVRKRDESDESKYKLICQKVKKFTTEMNQELNCAICIEIISDCATLIPCLHHFCGHCVTKLLKSSKECPLCRQKFQSWKKNSLMQGIIDSTTSVLRTSLSFEDYKQQTKLSEESKTTEENGIYIGVYSSDGKREGQGKMTYDNGCIYDGAWKNGQREGEGKMTYKDGKIYEGNWKNDKREGKGIITSGYYDNYNEDWIDDGNCKGEWIDDVLQPFVTIEYSNGENYFGEVKDGMKHGNGVLISRNYTSAYNGSWFNNQRQGWGKEIKAQRTYEGNWRNGKMHGHGKIEFRSGDVLEGDWFNGKLSDDAFFKRLNFDILTGKWAGYSQGVGTISFTNGKQFGGSWKKSSSSPSPYQKWTLTLNNGNVYEEIGLSISNIRQFHIQYADGGEYTGMIEMENLERQGKGKRVFDEGDEYDGDWDHDKKHGNGKYIWKNSGSVYEGQFQNGKMNGRGVLTNADGTKCTGEWKEGQKVVEQESIQEDSTNKN